jgi:integrase
VFIIGIDPHKGSHTAAVIDGEEQIVGEVLVCADRRQRDRLLCWAAPFEPRVWAVEGASGHGALLAQQLVASGETVVDVPAALSARARLLDSGRKDKSDPHDARSAAIVALRHRNLRTVSPCDRVPLPRIERNEMRFLDPDAVARLANAIDPRYRAFVPLGAYGGLRSGELFALRRGRLDLVRGRVDVAETAVEIAGHFHFGPPKTRAGRRSVPLPPFVVDELAQHVADTAVDELVFPAPEGGPVRASLFRRRTWEPAVNKAELAPLRPPDLRHTVALWIAAGASAHEVARRAGHTSSSVVLDRYGHLLPDAEERVTNALDNLGRASLTNARDAIVLEFPREERAKNGPERDASRPPRLAAPARTWGDASGASKNRTCDLILIRDAL